MSAASDPPSGGSERDRPAAADDEATRLRPRGDTASGGTAAARTAAPTAGAGGWSQAGYLQPGQLLGHTYEIEARLARGGMGEVYRARHVELGSRHAIKVILAELANDTRVVEMFAEEARKLRMVRDDAVVAYDGMFRDENGLRYLVMEFVDGVPLAQVIRQGPLAPGQLRHLRDRLAQGLAAAHDKLIYHRDISPDNIILVDGRVELAKIIDFGIAKAAGANDRTIIGSDFAGKYSYVSPEQLGMFGGNVDGRSDIYSLGLVLVAAALGRPLNMGNAPGSAVEARQRVPDLSALPEDLRQELAPLLEPDPANRPRSMRELPGSWIGSATTALPAAATARGAAPPAQQLPSPPPHRRSRAPLIAVVVALVAALGAGAAYLFLLSGMPAPAPSSAAIPAPPAPSVAAATPATEPPAPAPALPAAAPPASAPPAAAAAPPSPAPPSPAPAPPSPAPVPPSPAPAPVAALPPPSPAPPAALGRSEIAARIAGVTSGFRCADVKTRLAADLSLRVDGFVSSAADAQKLRLALGAVPGLRRVDTAVAVYAWPHCEVVKLLDDAGTLGAGAAPKLEFNKPSLVYRAGDKLVVRVAAGTGFDGHLYVDYLDNDGNVVHLRPGPQQPDNTVKAGQVITLGADGNYEISEPFGPNLVVAIYAPRRLFAAARPQSEKAQDYLSVLTQSLDATAKSGGKPVASAYAVIDTKPR